MQWEKSPLRSFLLGPCRFDENTKILIVDGAHGVGKTKFAKELAEELEMRYVPQPSMDYFYMSPYGHFHLRY